MKPWLLLATLAFCAPALRAQQSAPAPTELAQIDPAARDLLARLQARYQKFESFQSLISWEIGLAGKGLPQRRFRVQMTLDGKFVVGEEFPDKSWHKAICDGVTLVEFDSKFPKTYTRKSVKSPLYLGLFAQLEASLRSVNAEGPLLSMMLTNDFGAALLSPDLEKVTIQKSGALKEVLMRLHAPASSPTSAAFLEENFRVQPENLTLKAVEIHDENGLVFTESYAQTRFNPTFDETIFRAAAPLNYKLVPFFPDEVAATSRAPVVAAQ